VVGGQRLGDVVGEAVGPAVPAGAGEGDQRLVRGAGELVAGWPAFQQPQHGRGAQVVTRDRQRGREGRDEVLAKPVPQPPLVSGGALVVAGDGAQLGGLLPMRDERPQAGVAVQGQQAGDAGVFGVVFLGGGAAAAGDQVGVDRQDRVAGVHESFHEQAVAGLDHHPDLGRVRLQGGDLGDELVDRGWGVLHPAELDHPSAGRPRATRCNASAQSIPTPSTMPPFEDHRPAEARRRADGPVLTGRHPCGRRASRAVPLGRRLTSVLTGQASQAFPGGDPMSKEGNAISLAGNLTEDPESATPGPGSQGPGSGWPCRAGGSRSRRSSP
jgi:hypothetical protein